MKCTKKLFKIIVKCYNTDMQKFCFRIFSAQMRFTDAVTKKHCYREFPLPLKKCTQH